MNKLSPQETKLIGKWHFDGKEISADKTCERIKWLVKNELDEVAVSKQYGAWETLFRDRHDGRYWERTYPQGEMQGGGPPALECISEDVARKKYGIGSEQ